MVRIRQSLYTSNSGLPRLHGLTPIDGTCEWITQCPQLRHFLHSSTSAVLWISGPPGYGKTFLASSIASWARVSLPPQETYICQFFCDENFAQHSTASGILRGLIHQLLTVDISVLRSVVPIFEERGAEFLDGLDNLWSLFLEVWSSMHRGTILFVIDGLDECGENATLRKLIEQILKANMDSVALDVPTTKPLLKILFTSQPTVFLQRIFNSVPNAHFHLEEHINKVNDDIQRVITKRLDEIQSFKRISHSQRRRIEENLSKGAEYTFLWVSTVLNLLEESLEGSESAMERVINEMPEDLNAAYDKVLRRITQQHKDKAVFLFQIILAAKYPLTLTELNIILACKQLCNKGQGLTMDGLAKHLQPNIEQVLPGICGSILVILDDYVYFVHSTAREYLIGTSKAFASSSQAWRHSFNLHQSHEVLAKICMQYVQSILPPATAFKDIIKYLQQILQQERDRVFPSPTPNTNDVQPSSPQQFRPCIEDEAYLQQLYMYAARYWPLHFAASTDESLTVLAAELCSLAKGKPRHWVLWNYALKKLHSWPPYPLPEPLTPLMIATVADLSPLIGSFFKDEHEMSARTNCGQTLVHLAADVTESETLTKVLRHCSVSIDAIDLRGLAAIHKATQSSNLEKVTILIQQGASLNMQTSKEGLTPLNIAARWGNVEMVRLLLNHGADKELPDKQGCTPLINCCLTAWHPEDGDEGSPLYLTAVLLLEAGASVNHWNLDGQQPLHIAVRQHNFALIRALLKHGADPNARQVHLDSCPLHLVPISPEIIQILCAAGADINAKIGGAPFLHLVCELPVELWSLELLLQLGADILQKDAHGRTVLHLSVMKGNIAETKLLLTKMDVSCLDQAGSTPLFYACTAPMVALLSEHGTDVDYRNNLGNTALHSACASNIAEVITALLDCGADVEAVLQNGHGGLLRPIHIATRGADQDCIALQVLIRHGANLNSQTECGNTPIHEACIIDNVLALDALLRAGADIEITTKQGWTALHVSSSMGRTQCLKRLLHSNANIHAQTYDQSTPLHLAQAVDVARYLLQQHADVYAVDKNDRTPLHIARSIDIVRCLLQYGAQVRVRDCLGATPLHYQAALGSQDAIKLLLRAGADVNASCEEGMTPLHAVHDMRTAQLLLDCGADLFAVSSQGITATGYALLREELPLVHFYRSKGLTVPKIPVREKSSKLPIVLE